jgi:hypothetical protein
MKRIIRDRPVQPVEGEDIYLSGCLTVAVATAAIAMGVLLLGLGVVPLVFSPPSPPGPGWIWLALLLAGAGGGLLLAAGCYILRRRPRLIVGGDRLQFWDGNRFRSELPYNDIEQIVLTHVFQPSGARPSHLGIRLRAPAQYDALWPAWARLPVRFRERYGCDLPVSLSAASEPLERVLETILTAYHRYLRRITPE